MADAVRTPSKDQAVAAVSSSAPDSKPSPAKDVQPKGSAAQLKPGAELRSADLGAEFMMSVYKMLVCPRSSSHDWRTCPYGHAGENARRRHHSKYLSVCCPESKAKRMCPRGEDCPFAHSMTEYFLHPSRYKTQMCNDAPKCTRPICFFAHTKEELREPCYPSLNPGQLEALFAARASLSAESDAYLEEQLRSCVIGQLPPLPDNTTSAGDASCSGGASGASTPVGAAAGTAAAFKPSTTDGSTLGAAAAANAAALAGGFPPLACPLGVPVAPGVFCGAMMPSAAPVILPLAAPATTYLIASPAGELVEVSPEQYVELLSQQVLQQQAAALTLAALAQPCADVLDACAPLSEPLCNGARAAAAEAATRKARPAAAGSASKLLCRAQAMMSPLGGVGPAASSVAGAAGAAPSALSYAHGPFGGPLSSPFGDPLAADAPMCGGLLYAPAPSWAGASLPCAAGAMLGPAAAPASGGAGVAGADLVTSEQPMMPLGRPAGAPAPVSRLGMSQLGLRAGPMGRANGLQ